MTLKKMVNGVEVEMTPQEESEFLAQQALDAATVHIPTQVTMCQARLALLSAGVTANMVTTAINTLPSPEKEKALIEFEYQLIVRRDSSLVSALGPMLNLTSTQVDNLFLLADSI